MQKLISSASWEVFLKDYSKQGKTKYSETFKGMANQLDYILSCVHILKEIGQIMKQNSIFLRHDDGYTLGISKCLKN